MRSLKQRPASSVLPAMGSPLALLQVQTSTPRGSSNPGLQVIGPFLQGDSPCVLNHLLITSFYELLGNKKAARAFSAEGAALSKEAAELLILSDCQAAPERVTGESN